MIIHHSCRQRLVIAAIAAFGIILACLLAGESVWAASPVADESGEVTSGALLLRAKGATAQMPAVRLGIDMDVTVSGAVARVRVTQAFRNTSDKWMEATYLYPLPEDGAVDSLKMVVGKRIFVGKIKRREEARQAYEKALAEGRKAGLVESSRANLFRNSVANVGPGETVLIQIEYQAPVRQSAGAYSLRLPLVAGLRYVPPRTVVRSDGSVDLKAAADAADVNAPIADPSLGRSLNPVSIAVHLDPGFPPRAIASPYHKVTIGKDAAGVTTVVLADGKVPADRDFELSWRSADNTPAIGLFKQRFGGESYLMATVTPPPAEKTGPVPPREMIFVIDNSGSMAGSSMEAAKASLLYALDTLRPQDSFNIIRFDDTMTMLFEHAVPATSDQVALAKRFTRRLDADGGTEMLPALKAALAGGHEPLAKRLRQIIFLTDGGLSDEREMMSQIALDHGRSQVFMVGIGSAPNNYLMQRMAEAGRGTFTNVGIDSEAASRMRMLLDKLAAPAMQDLAVRIDGAQLELVPSDLPDLYSGEPLTLLGRGKVLKGKLTLSGKIDDKPWSVTLDLDQARDSPAVAKLWANRKIADIEAQRWSYQIEDADADEAVAKLGLEYGLVTTQTSLIAEDETPSRPKGARLTREELPLLLPAGWDFDHLFGEQNAQGASSAEDSSSQDDQLDLPQTATNFAVGLAEGLVLLVAGLAGLAWTRRRRGKEVLA